ncbi:hypothetical protein AAC387_Pa02g0026 [Persea americana]
MSNFSNQTPVTHHPQSQLSTTITLSLSSSSSSPLIRSTNHHPHYSRPSLQISLHLSTPSPNNLDEQSKRLELQVSTKMAKWVTILLVRYFLAMSGEDCKGSGGVDERTFS